MAFLYYLILQATSQDSPEVDQGSQQAIEADEEGKHLLTKRDVNNLVFRWQIMAEVPNSFARLQSLSFCAAFIPILKKLYGHDPEELSAALTRHLTFFNTEGVWGSVVHGIVMAMEEQRALGAPVPTEAINGIKAGLMGPFAGIGDTDQLVYHEAAVDHARASAGRKRIVSGANYLCGAFGGHHDCGKLLLYTSATAWEQRPPLPSWKAV